MRDSLHFLKAFAKNPRNMGAVLPSSKFLARRIVGKLDLGCDGSVLELGPGTGPFTREVHDQVGGGGRYLGIDMNADMVHLLSARFPAMRFVCGQAQSAEEHLEFHGIRNVRLIISGLPFAALPEHVQDGVMDSLVRMLRPGVEFRTFQYVHALRMQGAQRFRAQMTRRFGKPAVSRPVMLNVPPAVVLSWTGR